MLTSFDALDKVYSLVKNSILVTGSGDLTGITGGVYKISRPELSEYEDIVLSALPMTGDDVQMCLVNVNIHVPDIRVTINGRIQNQPNMIRMKALALLAGTVLESVYSMPFTLWIEMEHVLKQVNANEHYINIRVQVRTHKSIQSNSS